MASERLSGTANPPRASRSAGGRRYRLSQPEAAVALKGRVHTRYGSRHPDGLVARVGRVDTVTLKGVGRDGRGGLLAEVQGRRLSVRAAVDHEAAAPYAARLRLGHPDGEGGCHGGVHSVASCVQDLAPRPRRLGRLRGDHAPRAPDGLAKQRTFLGACLLREEDATCQRDCQCNCQCNCQCKGGAFGVLPEGLWGNPTSYPARHARRAGAGAAGYPSGLWTRTAVAWAAASESVSRESSLRLSMSSHARW